MTDSRTPPPEPAWTEQELDAALSTLAPLPPTTQLSNLRARIFQDDLAAADRTAVGWTPATRPGRRNTGHRGRKALVVATSVTALIGAGTFTAAATGVFNGQASQAFARGNTYPFHIDSRSGTLRVSAATPDGGKAELWTATGKDQCTAILLDDPGRPLPGKPYRPTAACGGKANDPAQAVGSLWQSSRSDAAFQATGGHTDADSATVTFSSLTGAAITAPVDDGYYLLFLPMTNGETPYNGLTTTDQQGHTHVLTKPHAIGADG
jgi:hypothetical protein